MGVFSLDGWPVFRDGLNATVALETYAYVWMPGRLRRGRMTALAWAVVR